MINAWSSGLVVFYLLAVSWFTMFFSLPSFHRSPAGTKTIKFLSVLQRPHPSPHFALLLLITAKIWEPPSIAVVVHFQP